MGPITFASREDSDELVKALEAEGYRTALREGPSGRNRSPYWRRREAHSAITRSRSADLGPTPCTS